MKSDFTWKVGGAQGEGIDSTGEIFALAVHRLGYYVYAYRHFMSLIKGGHTYYKVRLAPHQIRHRGDELDLLLAFDQGTIDYNLYEMAPGGAILYDSSDFQAKLPEGKDVTLIPVPLSQLAKESGSVIMKNMVAMGATAALTGLPVRIFEEFIEEKFGKKGVEVVASNKAALKAGFDYASQHASWRIQLPDIPAEKKGVRRLFMSGNDAIALGATLAGCRLVAAYPITPATEILYTLLRLMPKYGGAVIQAEDEMAACQMAIGANYAGVRAMTSTSGPGLSLMTESMGLAGMTETPLVIVDVQRAGPATGLPTKTEQGDLNQAAFSSHGEIPRIVLTPTTPEDCFYKIQEAFNLAERYQAVVVVLTDLVLGLSKMSVEVSDIDFDRIQIDRGERISDDELERIVASGEHYKRYALTESGISPRAIPGQPHARHIALGNEHDEEGHEMEDPVMRNLQMRKRFRKLRSLDTGTWVSHREGAEDPDLLFVGWGATIGPIHEVHERLAAEGKKVAHLQLSGVFPLPTAELEKEIKRAKHVLVVENNFTAQLADLIKRDLGYRDKLMSCLKYNGDPFYAKEIYAMAKEVV